MHITHIIALDPTKKQIKLFERVVKVSIFTYNWALEKRKELYKEKKDGKRKKGPTGPELDKLFNAQKHVKFPWVTTVSKNVCQGAICDLDAAYKRFFKKLGRLWSTRPW